MDTTTITKSCPSCGKEVPFPVVVADGVADFGKALKTLQDGMESIVHSHMEKALEEASARNGNAPATIDIASPINDALTLWTQRLEALQEAVTSHPTPAQTIDHWKSCPTCSKEYEATLDTIRPLTKVEPPALVSAPPKPEEKPRPPSPKRRLYEAAEDIPESDFVRGSYGIRTVREPDGRFSLQADSEEAGNSALEAGILEKGCSLKCDETGCWRVCEPE